MKIKKLLSIVFAVVLCFSSLTVIAYAEENTEHSSVEVDVSVVYRPLKSYVVIGVSSPELEGVILEITYPDGTSENVTIEKSDSDPLEYVAGKYGVYTNLFNDSQLISFGLNTQKIIVRYIAEDGTEYSGMCNDCEYLYLPSAEELFYFISALARIYNPFD